MTATGSAAKEEIPPDLRMLQAELAQVKEALAEALEVINAIKAGDVDALVLPGPEGERVFTLQGAEYAYRALVEAMNEGAATLDAKGIVLYCNQRLSDLVDIPLDRIIGNPAAQLVAASSASSLEVVSTRALNHHSAKAEMQLSSVTGCGRSAHISLREMTSGAPTVLCMVVTDLSEQKKHEELIAAGSLARSILASAAEGIAVCDQSGMIISANRALADLCGGPPLFQQFDEALPLQVSGEPGASDLSFSVTSVLSGMDHQAKDVTLQRRDGQTFSLLLSTGRIAGPSGVGGCVLTLTNITQRKWAEEALRNSERLYRAIGESINYGIWVCSPDGRNVYTSESFLRLVGITQQQCSDFGWSNLLPADDAERTMAAWAECVRTGADWDMEHVFRGADGQWHPILARGVPVRDDYGKIKCWAGFNLDISKLKEAEKALIRNEKLATLGHLAATIVHEINNPLGAVMNLLFLIKDDSLSLTSRQHIETAEAELRTISQIVGTTLGLARCGETAAMFHPVEVVDGVLALLDRKLRDKGIVLSRQVQIEQLEIVGAAGELRQVLWNVLNNAVDATANEGRITVRVSASRTWRRPEIRGVRITVADNGCGMAPETLRRVFEPFFTTKQTGTGLGLSVTSEIVQKHGGSIKLRSCRDAARRGTVLSLFIPMALPVEEYGCELVA